MDKDNNVLLCRRIKHKERAPSWGLVGRGPWREDNKEYMQITQHAINNLVFETGIELETKAAEDNPKNKEYFYDGLKCEVIPFLGEFG